MQSNFRGGGAGKSLICLEDKLINPCRAGKRCSLPFLPATPTSLSRTLEGLLELTHFASGATRTNGHSLRCAALGVEVPGHSQEQWTHILNL